MIRALLARRRARRARRRRAGFILDHPDRQVIDHPRRNFGLTKTPHD